MIVAELNDSLVVAKKGPISLDVVLDFEKGVDKIDLSGIDAKAGEEGHQAFSWVGNASGDKAGEVFAKTFGNMNAAEKSLGMEIDGIDGDSAFTGKVTVVFANTDGGEPEMALVLANVDSITSNDFLFI